MEKAYLGENRSDPSGFAVPPDGEVYIGIPALLQAHATALTGGLPKVTAHHELGHVFIGVEAETLAAWSKLNGPGHHYLRFFTPFRDRTKKSKGFADAYGEKDEAEDIATVFERMILEAGRFPETTDPGDTILANKVRFIKEHLQKISPEMDEEYWNQLAKGRK